MSPLSPAAPTTVKPLYVWNGTRYVNVREVLVHAPSGWVSPTRVYYKSGNNWALIWNTDV